MKKLFLLSSLFFIISSFGYTNEDLTTANSLADQEIITKQTIASKYGLDNKILRQEVIGMALKVKGITLPDNYTCKKYFADATKNDWVCRAVELAADNGIITRSNKYANPGKYVTRAEALTMMMKAGDIEVQESIGMSEGFGYYDKNGNMANDWQSDVLETARILEIMKPTFTTETGSVGGNPDFQQTYFKYYGRHNDLATRVEVFGFAKKILSQSITINPETRITIGSSPEIYIRPTTESESPEEKFTPSNNLSKLFLTQNHIGTIFHNEDNVLALSFFVLNETPLYNEKGYFYYGGLATSKANLRILRNMVYARHGRHFESKDLQEFFNTQSWYQENPNYTNAAITSIDQKNIDFIQEQENFLKI